ncbi:hypothetical protein NX801_04740 [Streptomyces sp. LP05-1]|uniref:Uncharacterized protein n=1 Tax=Streptomyces pyxinae TaxID=2970734 RepID=A0ABT2CC38_9ACTN|nr:hypothetical protein [Streptomyces sp. LP05-1]MCS0634977.1 hypothetical protein [Streptomyces sp. LP05-1]
MSIGNRPRGVGPAPAAPQSPAERAAGTPAALETVAVRVPVIDAALAFLEELEKGTADPAVRHTAATTARLLREARETAGPGQMAD